MYNNQIKFKDDFRFNMLYFNFCRDKNDKQFIYTNLYKSKLNYVKYLINRSGLAFNTLCHVQLSCVHSDSY